MMDITDIAAPAPAPGTATRSAPPVSASGAPCPAASGASTTAGEDCHKNAATSSLREIIDRRLLSALFQPIVDLQSGRFTGFEGLIRGPANSSLHSPAKLFAAAAQQELTLEVEMLARETVLRAFSAQQLPGSLFLNVSPEALADPGFRSGRTLAFLRSLSIDPTCVVIEITESQPTFDFDAMRDALLHYRAMGFRIAIDDLGAGFSSLRLWSELRPEFAKIDMHFVQGVDRDPVKLQFLKSIQQIAEQCGTRVIAEGVETEGELRVVRDIGIAFGQGYFIGRPGPAPPLLANVETGRVINASHIAVFPHLTLRTPQHTAFQLMVYVEPARPDTPIEDILARFSGTPWLHSIPLVMNGRPFGIVHRRDFIEQFVRPYQRDLHGRKPIGSMVEDEPLTVDRNTPLTELGHALAEAENRQFLDDFIVTESGRYLGIGSGQGLLRELTRMQLEAARYANPLTLLPGNVPINEHIDRLLDADADFVACHCDLDHFKPFNDTYGYRKGDEVIQLTGRILAGCCDPGRDFVGHIGGDDFVLLMQSADWQARCELALRLFDEAVTPAFRDEHRAGGGYASKGRNGKTRLHPLTSLSIGAVEVLPERLSSHHEVSAAMVEAKKMAKKTAGSSLFVERRHAPTAI